MPPKSKTSKAKGKTTLEGREKEAEAETKTLDMETNTGSDIPAVPAWRAEVVEEGIEEPSKPEEETMVKNTPAEEKVVEEPTEVAETLGEVKGEETPTLDLTMPEEAGGGGKGKKVFVIVFILVLVAGLLAGGLYYYKTQVSGGESPAKKEGPKPTEEVSSTPTPKEEVDLSEYKISVFNGSGIPGEAGKVETALKDQGFETIETANAETYDYTVSEVSLKKDTPEAVYEAVKKAMSGYKIVKQESALSESSDFDVEIIVGTTKSGSTPTPTP